MISKQIVNVNSVPKSVRVKIVKIKSNRKYSKKNKIK